tara:strand:+ start:141 stop:644 length:504 start_codon:yes stop_codon:yes gene_type:complete
MFENDEWRVVGGNRIHNTCIINDNVIMGTGNVIYPYTVIGLPGFIRDSDLALRKIFIGSNNWIGTNVSIMVGSEKDVTIGDDNLIMNYVNIGHDVEIGNSNEIGARSMIPGFCKIGSFNKIKLSCTIRNRVVIGDRNIIGMGSVVTKSFEGDDLLIYGSPAVIINNS